MTSHDWKTELRMLLLTIAFAFMLLGIYAMIRVVILKQPENCPVVEVAK